MKFSKSLLVSAALAASFGAYAVPVASLGGSGNTFLALSSSGLSGGAVATFTGTAPSIYSSDQGTADIPKGTVGNFLSVGPSSLAQTATLSFAPIGGTNYVSFLWGSPDTYNQLTVTDTAGSTTFTIASLAAMGVVIPTGPGPANQTLSTYIQFNDTAKITSLTFTNIPSADAFEASNFAVSLPVPEPETYALMLAGLGVLGFVARRRKQD